MSKNKLTLKINNQLADWQDFIKQKIEFIHPVSSSVDIEYNYFDGYKKIPCEADFHSSDFDLVLRFSEISEKEKERVLESLKEYDLEMFI